MQRSQESSRADDLILSIGIGQAGSLLPGPAFLTLDVLGNICSYDGPDGHLLGYRSEDLIRKPISTLLPQLTDVALVNNGQVNPRLDFLCHCGHLFETQSRDGTTYHSTLHFVCLEHAGKQTLRLIICPKGYNGAQNNDRP